MIEMDRKQQQQQNVWRVVEFIHLLLMSAKGIAVHHFALCICHNCATAVPDSQP